MQIKILSQIKLDITNELASDNTNKSKLLRIVTQKITSASLCFVLSFKWNNEVKTNSYGNSELNLSTALLEKIIIKILFYLEY